MSAAWEAHILWPENGQNLPLDLPVVALAGTVLAIGVLAFMAWHQHKAAPVVCLTIATAALLIAPAIWSFGTAAYEGGRPLARLRPVQDRGFRAGARQSNQIRALLPWLQANRGDAGFPWPRPRARGSLPR